jgi:hypothetical protein
VIANRVHRVPEALVLEVREVARGSEGADGALLPDGVVALQVLCDFGREDHEAAVGPSAVAAGLLLETGDAVVLEVEDAEAARGLDGR